MKKSNVKMKKILLAFVMMVFGVGLLAPSVGALKCPNGTIREGETVKSYSECNIGASESKEDIWSTVKVAINVVLGIVAVIAVIMIIIAGIEFTTSRGDATKTKKARDTIIYSVIGLVIALLSFAIVNFVLQDVFKSDGLNKKKTSYIEMIDSIN